ncbi:Phosphatidate cytidylyltransferase, mitochondrial [Smittium culicis]|uniref:Phosphatidate cytidylyltransferase, mitochondrial n=1 Tax=Smittium culicis TaxID=133412 RepID=A0A1R1X3R7_9FUNG|nr:Phosphatidate cytidylyltransferase, mitochondrial [Smittium culicis]OMJ15069.1 Phosphatidate cytidylyltransferase, mitochondrial [Smittium culicis]
MFAKIPAYNTLSSNPQFLKTVSLFYSTKLSTDATQNSSIQDHSLLITDPSKLQKQSSLNPEIQSVTPIKLHQLNTELPQNPLPSINLPLTPNTTTKIPKSSPSNIKVTPNVDSNTKLNLSLNASTKLSQDSVTEQARKKLSKSLLTNFDAPIKYAFAYGSGIFPQTPSSTSTESPQPPFSSGNMVDMIFAVSHPEHWHSINISQNPSHYSFLKNFGSSAVSFVQTKFGSGIYYNPYVQLGDLNVKYGVISLDSLVGDLLSWETCYVAGRMHKPTLNLIDNKFVRLCSRVNLATAARVALLSLPETFSEKEFFTTIATLSYNGDMRFSVGGEAPNKISNIVNNQIDSLRQMYSEVIEGLECVWYTSNISDHKSLNGSPLMMQQNMDPEVRSLQVFKKLPAKLKAIIAATYENNYSLEISSSTDYDSSDNKTAIGIVSSPNIPELVSASVQSIVRWPSFTQSIKGIFSAGLYKSYKYAKSKRSKARNN